MKQSNPDPKQRDNNGEQSRPNIDDEAEELHLSTLKLKGIGNSCNLVFFLKEGLCTPKAKR